MRNFEILQCSLYVICFINSGFYAQLLDLYEGEICYKSNDDSYNHICRRIDDCAIVNEGIKQNIINPQICSFDKSTVIVCCPPEKKITSTTNSFNIPTETTQYSTAGKLHKANEMCRQYSELIYTSIKDPILTGSNQNIKIKNCIDVLTLIVNGTKAVPKEFPHMVLIGYNKEKPDNRSWFCGGSLISDTWILTAAHCEKISNIPASWARLGELNYLTYNDGTIHQDYKIVQRIIHPSYQPSRAKYNDLALFRLEKKVMFSEYVRPVCINTNQFLKTSSVIASGWGQTANGEAFSPDLLKVILNTVPAKICNKTYPKSNISKLPYGIDDDSMICAGSNEGKDTCGGDSGGPIQIKHINYTCMYLQIGITSFGRSCAEKNSPAVYTKVSKYIQWIENIVWPTI